MPALIPDLSSSGSPPCDLQEINCDSGDPDSTGRGEVPIRHETRFMHGHCPERCSWCRISYCMYNRQFHRRCLITRGPVQHYFDHICEQCYDRICNESDYDIDFPFHDPSSSSHGLHPEVDLAAPNGEADRCVRDHRPLNALCPGVYINDSTTTSTTPEGADPDIAPEPPDQPLLGPVPPEEQTPTEFPSPEEDVQCPFRCPRCDALCCEPAQGFYAHTWHFCNNTECDVDSWHVPVDDYDYENAVPVSPELSGSSTESLQTDPTPNTQKSISRVLRWFKPCQSLKQMQLRNTKLMPVQEPPDVPVCALLVELVNVASHLALGVHSVAMASIFVIDVSAIPSSRQIAVLIVVAMEVMIVLGEMTTSLSSR